MAIEQWKDIPEYEGYYKISNTGNVCSLNRMDSRGSRLVGRMLNPITSNYGYLIATLCRNSICIKYRVHRLVLLAFVGGCPKEMEGCHNNGIRSDNHLSNLRWDTRKNNAIDMVRHGNSWLGSQRSEETKKQISLAMKGIERSKETKKKMSLAKKGNRYSAKLTQKQVNKIRKLWVTGKYYQRELANIFSISSCQISSIVNYKRWSF